MRILEIFEWIAAMMIAVAVLLGLGKVAVDQVVYQVTRPVVVSAAIRPVTEEEKRVYLTGLRHSVAQAEQQLVAEMEARARGDR